MRFLVKSTICVMAAMAVLASCKKDDTIQYNNLTMGNVVNGTFISDQGNIFTVVENNTSTDLSTYDRAIILCDVLKKVENRDNEYEIRLNSAASVLVKDAITTTEADSDKETEVTDPIFIQEMWASGGYLNFSLVYEFKGSSQQKHLINLVFNEAASKDGKYSFELRHNSYGEASIYDATQLIYGGAYISIPIKDLISENSAEIIVDYNWYKSAGYGWLKETQDYQKTTPYTKGGYEQAPAKLPVKTTVNLN